MNYYIYNMCFEVCIPYRINDLGKIMCTFTHKLFGVLFNLFKIHSSFYSPLCLTSECSPFHTFSLIPYLHKDVPTTHPSPQTYKLPGAFSVLRFRRILSDWIQTRQSSAVYVLGASYQLVYAVWMVVQCLRDLSVLKMWYFFGKIQALMHSFQVQVSCLQ